jgi:hypothetical protein
VPAGEPADGIARKFSDRIHAAVTMGLGRSSRGTCFQPCCCHPAGKQEADVSKILAAGLAACIVVLTSQPGEARMRIRMSAPSKPAAAVAPKPVPSAAAQKPMAATKPAAGGMMIFPIVRPAAAATRPQTEQRAVSEPMNAYSGPAQFTDPPPDNAADAAKPEPEAPAKPKTLEASTCQPIIVAGTDYPVRRQARAEPPALPARMPVYCFVQASGGCKSTPY